MILHYINLVCWRDIWPSYDSQRDRYFIDSVTLFAISRIIRKDALWHPGSNNVPKIVNAATKGEGFFLVAQSAQWLSGAQQFVLPYFQELYVPDDLALRLNQLPTGADVYLGISAPKQNHLAILLHQIRPDLTYHCLGAALTGINDSDNVSQSRARISGSGLEWIAFFRKAPRRTAGKIFATLTAVLRIIVIPKDRQGFCNFIRVCATQLEPPYKNAE